MEAKNPNSQTFEWYKNAVNDKAIKLDIGNVSKLPYLSKHPYTYDACEKISRLM